jgi:hypothetical protein
LLRCHRLDLAHTRLMLLLLLLLLLLLQTTTLRG